MNRSQQANRFARDVQDGGRALAQISGFARKRIARAELARLEKNQTEAAGKKREPAACVREDIVNFLARPVPKIERFRNRP